MLYYQGRGNSIIRASGLPLHQTPCWMHATFTNPTHPQLFHSPNPSVVSAQAPGSPAHTTVGSSTFSRVFLFGA